jgi:hypothetical protein
MPDSASPRDELRLLEQKRLTGDLTPEEEARPADLPGPAPIIGGFDVNAAAAEVQASAAAPWPRAAASTPGSGTASGPPPASADAEPLSWRPVELDPPAIEAEPIDDAAPMEPVDLGTPEWEVSEPEPEPSLGEPAQLGAEDVPLDLPLDAPLVADADGASGFSWEAPASAPSYAPDPTSSWSIAEGAAAAPPDAQGMHPSAPAEWSQPAWTAEAYEDALAVEALSLESGGSFSPALATPLELQLEDEPLRASAAHAEPLPDAAPEALELAPEVAPLDAAADLAGEELPPLELGGAPQEGEVAWGELAIPPGEPVVDLAAFEAAPAPIEEDRTALWSLDGDQPGAPPLQLDAVEAAARAPDEPSIDVAEPVVEEILEVGEGDLVEVVPEDVAAPADVDVPAVAAEPEPTFAQELPAVVDAFAPLDMAFDAAPTEPLAAAPTAAWDAAAATLATVEPLVEVADDGPDVAVAPEPILDAAPEPVLDAPPEPAFEVVPEPVAEPAAELDFDAVPDPVIELPGEPAAEDVPPLEVAPEPLFAAPAADDIVPEPLFSAPAEEAAPEPEPVFASPAEEPAPVADAAPEETVAIVIEPLVDAAPEPVAPPPEAEAPPIAVPPPPEPPPRAEPIAAVALAQRIAIVEPAAAPEVRAPSRPAFDPFADLGDAADAAPSPAVSPAQAAAAAREAGAFVTGRHRVVLHTADGQVKRGTVADAALDAGEVVLQPQAGGAAEAIPSDRIRAIFFMLASGETPSAPSGKKVRVTFRDGRQVAGFSADYAPERPGFFMVPADTRTHTARIWVYRASVRQVSVS